MESYFQSRIPLSVSNRQKFAKIFPRNPLTTINLNQRFCDSLANTKPSGTTVSKNPCSICLMGKKPPPPQPLKHPPLDDYKGRFINLLEKFEIVNNKLTLTKSELVEHTRKSKIIEEKLAAAETELKSVRHDLRRTKATNKSNELTIGVLERKIVELKDRDDASEEMHVTRFGRSIHPPDKYQSSS